MPVLQASLQVLQELRSIHRSFFCEVLYEHSSFGILTDTQRPLVLFGVQQINDLLVVQLVVGTSD